MKLLVLFISVTLLASGLNAENGFRQLSKQYQNQPDFFAAELSKKTIKLYLKEKTPSLELSKVLDKLETLSVIRFSVEDNIEVVEQKATIFLKLDEYTPLKTTNSAGIKQQVLIREEKDLISDLIIKTTTASEFAIVYLKGEIDLKHIASLNEGLNINGLDALNEINQTSKPLVYDPSKSRLNKNKKNPYFQNPSAPPQHLTTPSSKPKFAPTSGFRAWLINEEDNHSVQPLNRYRSLHYSLLSTTDEELGYMCPNRISIYDKWREERLKLDQPTLLVNGYKSYLIKGEGKYGLGGINPECINSINFVKGDVAGDENSNGIIDVSLKGNCNHIYILCEGTLYFGQNDSLQTIDINDECAPRLLVDCEEKPLIEIESLEPEVVKSIELSDNPRNCEGELKGQYVVLVTVK